MKRFAVISATVLSLLAAAFFQIPGRSRADIDKGMHAALSRIAKALEKGDKATARKEAKALARKIEDLDDLMRSYKPRNKRGLGVGSKPSVVRPDGIEQKLYAIARDGIAPLQLAKEGEALTEAARMMAAIAEVTQYMWRGKDIGQQREARWIELATGVRDGARDLAAAAKKMDVMAVKAAAVKITNNCNNCHLGILFGPPAGQPKQKKGAKKN